jgi:hypothetical protein
MPQIINENNWGGRAGGAFGEGLGEGLSYLINDKLGQMQNSRKQSQYSDLLQKTGIDARDANLLAYHAVNSPQTFHQILEQYTPRTAQLPQQQPYNPQQQSRPGIPQIDNQQAQLAPASSYNQPGQPQTGLQNLMQTLGAPQQQPSPQQPLGEGVDLLRRAASHELLKEATGQSSQGREPSALPNQLLQQQAQQPIAQNVPPAQIPPEVSPQQLEEQLHPLQVGKKGQEKQEKRDQELVKTRSDLVDFVETSKKALDNAKKANFGTVSSIYAENPHLRGRLDQYTSAFDTQATHLANLKAGLIKGVVSVQRLKGIQREKPSVGKSKEENIRDLQEYIKEGQQQLNIFDKDHPDVARKFQSESQGNQQNQQAQGLSEQELRTPVQDQSGNLSQVVQDDNGNYYLWDDRTRTYRPAKLKGK